MKKNKKGGSVPQKDGKPLVRLIYALTSKQMMFCEEYMKDFNGTQAAIRAGYSKKTARSIASEYLTKPDIGAYIMKLQEERSKKIGITSEMIVEELGKIGFSNIQDYIKKGFTIDDIETIKREHAAAIQSITIENMETKSGNVQTIKFKLHDKISALEKLGRHIGFFKKDNEQQKSNVVLKVGYGNKED